jgi:hypothetical protein
LLGLSDMDDLLVVPIGVAGTIAPAAITPSS